MIMTIRHKEVRDLIRELVVETYYNVAIKVVLQLLNGKLFYAGAVVTMDDQRSARHKQWRFLS